MQNFTEKEAEAKEGRWVCVRDDSFLSDGVPAGTRGQVVCAQLLGTVDSGEVWAVNVRFYPAYILIENIGKEQYQGSLEETDQI
jgi:hypothetical protein